MIARGEARGDLLRVLLEVDALDDESAGELRVLDRSGDAVGVIFVERRRVCWAAARGLARRLSDLLVAQASLDRGTIEACHRLAREEGVPFGELLVGRGLLAPPRLRDALRQHTLESLRLATGLRAGSTFHPRRVGYAPRFTFSTGELLALDDPDDRAVAAVRAHFQGNGWGAAFARGEGADPRLVAIEGRHPDDATSIARLGRWAASVVDLAKAMHGASPLLSARSSFGSYVAFAVDDLLLAGEVPPHGAARILNRRANARRANAGAHGRF